MGRVEALLANTDGGRLVQALANPLPVASSSRCCHAAAELPEARTRGGLSSDVAAACLSIRALHIARPPPLAQLKHHAPAGIVCWQRRQRGTAWALLASTWAQEVAGGVAWRGVACLACWTPLSGATDTQDKSCTRHGVACQALWHGAQAGGHAQVAPGPPCRSDRQQRKQSAHRTTLSASATSSRGMRCRRSSKYLRLTCSRPGENQWLEEELYQEQRDNKSIDTENARSSIVAAGAAAG